MSLSWKDGVTTVLAALTGYVYWASANGKSLPWTDHPRWMIIILAIIGFSMCALSTGATVGQNMYTTTAGILGVVSFLLIVYGLVTGSATSAHYLAIAILALWAIATLRHVVMK